MSDFLVTVASYWFLSDALVAQNALDAAGIDSVLDDENMATNITNAVRGVKLRVRNIDAIRAGEVLESQCESLDEIEEPDEIRIDPNSCPACGSLDVARNPRLSLFAIIAVLALGAGIALNISEAAFFGVLAAAVLLLISDRNRCTECGETWN
ncbi:MAG: hypothetical protein DMF56_11520 [Acidobacteria bacterium]|nr:MAG: hypothetical protein DMF56_11520 [Acidobacteriota bacterium]